MDLRSISYLHGYILDYLSIADLFKSLVFVDKFWSRSVKDATIAKSRTNFTIDYRIRNLPEHFFSLCKNLKRIETIFFSNARPRNFWYEQGYDYYAGL